MGKTSSPRLWRFLPLVVVATFVVAVLPLVVVWALRASGAVESTVLLIVVGVALSIGIAAGGRAFWERRPGSGDLVFAELMIWGWVKRWRIERRLASAVSLLGLDGKGLGDPAEGLTPERRARLLEDLANALEARDPYTHGHSRRVARHATMIAKRMNLSRGEVAKIRAAAAVHDVGKIETPIEVLNKPGRLTDEEFAIVKQHALRGGQMVNRLIGEELAWIVALHHERIDGTGYPTGASGQDIPLGARIIAVADTFDAITSTRPYRSAKPHKRALDILHKESGKQLDADAVRAFLSCYSGFRPLALWVVATNLPQRLLQPAMGQAGAASGGSISAAKMIAVTAATAAAGSAFAGSPALGPPSDGPRQSGLGAQVAAASFEPGEQGEATLSDASTRAPGSPTRSDSGRGNGDDAASASPGNEGGGAAGSGPGEATTSGGGGHLTGSGHGADTGGSHEGGQATTETGSGGSGGSGNGSNAAHGGNPPGQGSNPGHGGTPPGQGANPPGQGANPPGQGSNPGHGATPPGQAGTPPGQGADPPGQGSNPGNGATPPGQGGTPPGQGNPKPAPQGPNAPAPGP